MIQSLTHLALKSYSRAFLLVNVLSDNGSVIYISIQTRRRPVTAFVLLQMDNLRFYLLSAGRGTHCLVAEWPLGIAPLIHHASITFLASNAAIKRCNAW